MSIRGMSFNVDGEVDDVTSTSFDVYLGADGRVVARRTLHVRGSCTKTDRDGIWYPSLVKFCREQRVTYAALQRGVTYALALAASRLP
jgi:hypothetical protein